MEEDVELTVSFVLLAKNRFIQILFFLFSFSHVIIVILSTQFILYIFNEKEIEMVITKYEENINVFEENYTIKYKYTKNTLKCITRMRSTK